LPLAALGLQHDSQPRSVVLFLCALSLADTLARAVRPFFDLLRIVRWQFVPPFSLRYCLSLLLLAPLYLTLPVP
jgi:hypothetical protein